jgi:hypothetical protein
MSTKFTITVPTSMREHPPVQQAINVSTLSAGGCTKVQAIGVWHDYITGAAVEEPVEELSFICGLESLGRVWYAIEAVVDSMLDAGEIAVLVQRMTGGVYSHRLYQQGWRDE